MMMTTFTFYYWWWFESYSSLKGVICFCSILGLLGQSMVARTWVSAAASQHRYKICRTALISHLSRWCCNIIYYDNYEYQASISSFSAMPQVYWLKICRQAVWQKHVVPQQYRTTRERKCIRKYRTKIESVYYIYTESPSYRPLCKWPIV